MSNVAQVSLQGTAENDPVASVLIKIRPFFPNFIGATDIVAIKESSSEFIT